MTDDTAFEAPKKRFTLRRILLGFVILVLLVVLGFAIHLRNVATARYTADVLTLVPADMAIVVEARRLGERQGARDQIVGFFRALFEDDGYDDALGSQSMIDIVGRDPGDPRRARDFGQLIDEGVERIRKTAIPVGDSLFGKVDAMDDFFGGDIVYSIRARHGLPRTPDGKMLADVMLLVRVSGRIKIYSSFDSWASSFLPRSIRLDVLDGYSTLTIKDGRGPKNDLTIGYALVGDVFAISNHVPLIREVVELGKARGTSGASMFESPLYAEALSASAAAIGSTDELQEATLRVFTNQDAVRHIAEVDNHLDKLFDSAKEVSGGEFIGNTGDDIVRSVIDLRAVRATSTLVRLETDRSGPTVIADTAVLYDADRMRPALVNTIAHGGADSALFDLGAGNTFIGAAIGKDMTALVSEMELSTRGESPSIVLEIFQKMTANGYLGDEIGFVMDDQSREDLQEGEPTWPNMIFAFRLSPQGMLTGRDLTTLAELAFQMPRSTEAETSGRSMQYLLESTGSGHQYARFFMAEDPETNDQSRANNRIHRLMRSYLGPEVEPACAIIQLDDAGQDGYFLLSTNVEYLTACLDTWAARDQRASVFRRLGGPGVATAWFSPGPTILRGLIDVSEMYSGWRSEDAIRIAYENTLYDRAPPSVARQLRQQAIQRSGGDEVREEELYRQLENHWLAQDRARVQTDINKALEFRKMAQVAQWVGYQLRAIDGADNPTRVHLRVVAALGSR